MCRVLGQEWSQAFSSFAGHIRARMGKLQKLVAKVNGEQVKAMADYTKALNVRGLMRSGVSVGCRQVRIELATSALLVELRTPTLCLTAWVCGRRGEGGQA